MRRIRSPGTGIRRSLDTKRLASALTMPGIDSRLWCSFGTVGTMDEDGNIDPNDWTAIWQGPEGVEVDVRLEPLRIPATCHYYGMAGGRAATITSPIRPGDLVLVHLPGGDPNDLPVIAAILHSAAHKVPLGTDRKPIFDNTSVFVWAEDVLIDIRTKGGARIQLKQDGTIEASGDKVSTVTDDTRLGATDAPEQLVLGTSYRAAEQPAFVALAAWVSAVAAAIAAATGPTIPQKAAVAAATVALSPLLGPLGSNPYLSNNSRTK